MLSRLQERMKTVLAAFGQLSWWTAFTTGAVACAIAAQPYIRLFYAS
jgi:hypothetical protein